MKILLNNHALHKTLEPYDDIGLVPTMGTIHEGHISLINKSIKFSKKTLVSIFINPKSTIWFKSTTFFTIVFYPL